MKKSSNKAITIVELIIVISILAILGVIGFIAIQQYTISARDAVRVYDVNNISSVLEYSYTESGRYPLPDGATSITYSGSTVWNQGTFGKKSRRVTKRLDKVPVDPLTGNEYTYSVSGWKGKFELGTIAESEVGFSRNRNLPAGLFLEKSYADTSSFSSYIRGNYNGIVTKVHTGGLDYLLAVPTIISEDITNTQLLNIISDNKLAPRGSSNIAHSYNIDTPNNPLIVNNNTLLLYTGSVTDLIEKESDRIVLIENLQKAYSGTISTHGSQISGIVNTLVDTESPSDTAKNTAANLVNALFIDQEENKLTLLDIPDSSASGSVISGSGIADGNQYAWGENTGWIDFKPVNGDVHITDTGITGSAWGESTGWITMQPANGGVTNTCAGVLSGSAWAQNYGWINFSSVTIDTNGFFQGTANILNGGNITFSGTNFNLQTDWRPDCS